MLGTADWLIFIDALAGILEKNFGVKLVNVNEYDDRGEVFGRPDKVELGDVFNPCRERPAPAQFW